MEDHLSPHNLPDICMGTGKPNLIYLSVFMIDLLANKYRHKFAAFFIQRDRMRNTTNRQGRSLFYTAPPYRCLGQANKGIS